MNDVCNVMYNVKEWGVFQAKRQSIFTIKWLLFHSTPSDGSKFCCLPAKVWSPLWCRHDTSHLADCLVLWIFQWSGCWCWAGAAEDWRCGVDVMQWLQEMPPVTISLHPLRGAAWPGLPRTLNMLTWVTGRRAAHCVHPPLSETEENINRCWQSGGRSDGEMKWNH